MEFLLTTKGFSGFDTPESLNGMFESHAFEGRHPARCMDFGTFWFIRKCDEELNDATVIFDGYLFADVLRHPRYKPPDRRIAEEAFSELWHTAGGFVVGLLEHQAFQLRPDLLGQYHIYYYAIGTDCAVSNNAQLLERFVKSKRMPEHAAFTLSYLSAFKDQAISSPISAVEGRYGLKYDIRRGLRSVELATRGQIYRCGDGYEENLQAAAHAITENCRMISEFSQNYKVYTAVDLSGGVDTRITLAGFVGSNQHGSVFFNNVNSDPGKSADRVAAETIASSLNLPVGASIAAGPKATTTLNSRYRYSLCAKIAYGVGHYFGQIPASHADYGELVLDRYARVGGYCGEHTRAPGPNLGRLVRTGSSPAEFSNAVMGHLTREHVALAHDFLNPSGLAVVAEQLQAYLNEILTELPPRLANTVMYVENRSRYHFGTRTQNANRSSLCVSPLSTPQILSMHQHLTYPEIFNNRIAHDLIVRMGGEQVAYLPFASNFWRRNVLPDKVNFDAQEVVQGREAGGQSVCVDPISLRRSSEIEEVDEFEEWRRREGAEDCHEAILSFALESAGQDVWSMLDRNTIGREARRSREKGRKTVKRFTRPCAALLFHLGLDRHSKLRETIDPRPLLKEANKDALGR